jgi:hypothetical protein
MVTEGDFRKNIFSWIDKTLVRMSQEEDSEESDSIDRVKDEIIKSFRELRSIDIEACQMTIDSWFDESLQEKLIF